MSLRCLIWCDFLFVLLLYICVCVWDLHIHWIMSHLLYAMPCGKWKFKTHSPVCQGAYNQIDKYSDHFWTISKLKKNWLPPNFFFWLGNLAIPRPGINPMYPWVEVRHLNHWTVSEAPAPHQIYFKANILKPQRIFLYKNFVHLIVFKFSLPQMTECIQYSAWVQ